MASSELNWTALKSYELDSTEGTTEDKEEDHTEGTTDEEVNMNADSTDETADKFFDADSTDLTQDKFGADSTDGTSDKFAERIGTGQSSSKVPQSEIVVRTISVERSAPLAGLPADADAAFGQWLNNSGLAPSKH